MCVIGLCFKLGECVCDLVFYSIEKEFFPIRIERFVVRINFYELIQKKIYENAKKEMFDGNENDPLLKLNK